MNDLSNIILTVQSGRSQNERHRKPKLDGQKNQSRRSHFDMHVAFHLRPLMMVNSPSSFYFVPFFGLVKSAFGHFWQQRSISFMSDTFASVTFDFQFKTILRHAKSDNRNQNINDHLTFYLFRGFQKDSYSMNHRLVKANQIMRANQNARFNKYHFENRPYPFE